MRTERECFTTKIRDFFIEREMASRDKFETSMVMIEKASFLELSLPVHVDHFLYDTMKREGRLSTGRCVPTGGPSEYKGGILVSYPRLTTYR